MKLSDNEAHDRLVKAREALGDESAETVRANAALETARRSLVMLQIALMTARANADQD
mgnify:CR=1 FL=1